MFKKFNSLITSCIKHISIYSNLRDSIIKLMCLIDESESKINIKYGIACLSRTYDLMDLIISFCNIYLFKCDNLIYKTQSLEINKQLKTLCSELDSIKINNNTTKKILLNNINRKLYIISYNIQEMVLNQKENAKIKKEDKSTLVSDILNYFDNKFENDKEYIYKYIDEFI